MVINENGILREATAEEIESFNNDMIDVPTEVPTESPLIEMAESMATATTLAQMRAAAKKFLESTEEP